MGEEPSQRSPEQGAWHMENMQELPVRLRSHRRPQERNRCWGPGAVPTTAPSSMLIVLTAAQGGSFPPLPDTPRRRWLRVPVQAPEGGLVPPAPKP